MMEDATAEYCPTLTFGSPPGIRMPRTHLSMVPARYQSMRR
jgi:hypothetical protein